MCDPGLIGLLSEFLSIACVPVPDFVIVGTYTIDDLDIEAVKRNDVDDKFGVVRDAE